MIRVWIAEKGLHVSLRVGVYDKTDIDELNAWGIILADIIRHLGDAMKQKKNIEIDEVIEEVVNSMLDELEKPTSRTEGTFLAG